jgi:hypothetical protein
MMSVEYSASAIVREAAEILLSVAIFLILSAIDLALCSAGKACIPLTENRVISSMMTGAVSIACSDGRDKGGSDCAAKLCPVRTAHIKKKANKIFLISIFSPL